MAEGRMRSVPIVPLSIPVWLCCGLEVRFDAPATQLSARGRLCQLLP